MRTMSSFQFPDFRLNDNNNAELGSRKTSAWEKARERDRLANLIVIRIRLEELIAKIPAFLESLPDSHFGRQFRKMLETDFKGMNKEWFSFNESDTTEMIKAIEPYVKNVWGSLNLIESIPGACRYQTIELKNEVYFLLEMFKRL